MSKDLMTSLENIDSGVSFGGVTLLRDLLIPELLDKNTGPILYWAGKELARKLPLPDIQHIQDFFILASLGNLDMVKQKRNQYIFELSGDLVAQRQTVTDKPDFQFETGFIAQQLQRQLGVVAEGIDEVLKHGSKIRITIQVDPKDKISDDTVIADTETN